jgi:hypothetical protein
MNGYCTCVWVHDVCARVQISSRDKAYYWHERALLDRQTDIVLYYLLGLTT